jgi:hypothetical protein
MTVSCKNVFRARNRCINVTETTENSDMIQLKRGKKTCHQKARNEECLKFQLSTQKSEGIKKFTKL